VPECLLHIWVTGSTKADAIDITFCLGGLLCKNKGKLYFLTLSNSGSYANGYIVISTNPAMEMLRTDK
jgi:hypothetical protein